MSQQVQITLTDRLLSVWQRYARGRNQQLAEAIADYLEENPPVDAPVAGNLVHESDPEMEREMAAYRTMHASLMPKYLGSYVAIKNGELVDTDVDKQQLIERINSRYGSDFVLIHPVLEEVEQVLHFRSPFYQ